MYLLDGQKRISTFCDFVGRRKKVHLIATVHSIESAFLRYDLTISVGGQSTKIVLKIVTIL